MPVHVERRTDAFGEYEERWMVEPPPEGTLYRVIEESWSEDYSVRTVRRWEETACICHLGDDDCCACDLTDPFTERERALADD